MSVRVKFQSNLVSRTNKTSRYNFVPKSLEVTAKT